MTPLGLVGGAHDRDTEDSVTAPTTGPDCPAGAAQHKHTNIHMFTHGMKYERVKVARLATIRNDL